MLQVGDMQIHFIQDSLTWVDPGGAFGLVPRSLWMNYYQPNDDYLIPMVNLCLYTETAGKKVVIDTAMGQKIDDKTRRIFNLQRENGDLIAALARLGVQPGAVDLVINTHLHADHCGGNTYLTEAGEIAPTFPNAEYVVQRREYEDAIQPNERTAATYYPFNYQPLVESGQMRLLDGDTELLPGITGIVSRGHTPGHMAVRFESRGEHAAYLCDMASYAVHFERLGWMTAYDVEPLHTLETKRAWQGWALATNAVLIFAHEVERPAGRLMQEEGKRPYIDPVAITYA